MIIVRPVKTTDLKALYDLSSRTKVGLTTLPHDKQILKNRINLAVNSFSAQAHRPGTEYYLFVMEDLAKAKVIGTSGIFAKVGGFEPFYTYEIKEVKLSSKSLKVKKSIKYLQLLTQHNGPSEIGTLFLDAQYRKKNIGRMLSLSRFLFMAQYRHCFEDDVISELRGVIDDTGRAPFWEVLGKHFFEVDFKKADFMVMKDKTFIADLMPKHPIYIPLLPKHAQKIIGKVHHDTEPALHLLLKEHFHITNQIDIFEAGPVLQAKVKEIRTVKESVTAVISEIVDKEIVSEEYLIANITKFKDFRVTVGSLGVQKNGRLRVSSSLAQALGLVINSKVRFVKLRTKRR